MRALSAATALALVSAPAFAQGFTEDQKAALIAVAITSDCDLTIAEVLETLPESGVDEQVAEAIATDLIDRNLATLSEDMKLFTLDKEICQ